MVVGSLGNLDRLSKSLALVQRLTRALVTSNMGSPEQQQYERSN